MNQTIFSDWWWLIALGALWEFGWKGWALWRAARRNEKAWFVVLLLVNTLGILPIAYIFIFSKQNPVQIESEA